MKPKLLICGDSFSADWTQKYAGQGWPNLLAQDFEITNLSQAGCSEYRIYLQIQSQIDHLEQYDHVIVSHTSPYRIYVEHHPVHYKDVLHAHSDFIYNDCKEHALTHPELTPVIKYFEQYFSMEHAEFVHNLTCEKIDTMLDCPVLHMAHADWKTLYQFQDMMLFNEMFHTHPGLLNHYSDLGNQLVYSAVRDRLINTPDQGN